MFRLGRPSISDRHPRPMAWMVVGLCFIMPFLLTCSDDKNPIKGPTRESILANVRLVPSSGPPGKWINVQGLDSLPALPKGEVWTLRIGGCIVPVLDKPGQPLRTVVPLLFAAGDSSWPVVPSRPVSLVLFKNDEAVDSLPAALTVEMLPHADGMADSVVSSLQGAAAALRSLAETCVPRDTLACAILTAIDSMIAGDANSLAEVIAGKAPNLPDGHVSKELIAALMASTGTGEAVRKWSSQFQKLKTMALSPAPSVHPEAPDMQLAYKMQIGEYVRSFDEGVLEPTEEELRFVFTFLGLPAIGYDALRGPLILTSALISQIRFVAAKILVAMYPDEITELSLWIQDHTVAVGDTTTTYIAITAKSNPPPITLQDVVTQILNGLTYMEVAEEAHLNVLDPGLFRIILDRTILWALEFIREVVHVETGQDWQVGSLPSRTWGPTRITTPKLLEMESSDAAIASRMTGHLTWKGIDIGTADVHVFTPEGPVEAVTHPKLLWAGYAGGVFGEAEKSSDTQQLEIINTLILEANLPGPIPPQGASMLHVVTSYPEVGGGTRPAEGVAISLSVTGGNAEQTSGMTDATGQFVTLVRPSLGSTAVSILVLATPPNGDPVQKWVGAGVGVELPEGVTFAAGGMTARANWTLNSTIGPEDMRTLHSDTTAASFGGTATAHADTSFSDGEASADASVSWRHSVTFSPGTGELNFQASGDHSFECAFRVNHSPRSYGDAHGLSGGGSLIRFRLPAGRYSMTVHVSARWDTSRFNRLDAGCQVGGGECGLSVSALRPGDWTDSCEFYAGLSDLFQIEAGSSWNNGVQGDSAATNRGAGSMSASVRIVRR
jgi:hypothetical protein